MISFSALYERQCQSAYCDGVRWLNAEEQRAPAICAICSKRICDECAAGGQLPYDVLDEKPWTWKEHYEHCQGFVSQFGEHLEAKDGWCPHDKPTDDQRYDCLVCSDCFKEEWV